MIVYVNSLQTVGGAIGLLLQIIWNKGESESEDQLSYGLDEGSDQNETFHRAYYQGLLEQ